ncbi:carbohydrate ABC transporter permease [Anaerocolumna sp. MB42-C2]|uniref:carbohydrate ABC transporter permease n=1 Tax=Anaerocolumna sp. MB42-C2 TaxID=3070997 RepID=UPI0027DF5D4E|nr:sugar ABC transporter permease [Anaerocolumna sp. MB42-C2]WMJ87082.1 sugar ABC transporter permease [Anaerocolumna sp. MB42-C2]
MKLVKEKSFMNTKIKSNIVGWAFALPAILGFLFLNLIPMLLSGYYSFCDYNIISKPVWSGLNNYVSLFNGTDATFWLSVKATLLYTIMAVPANLIFALTIALLLNRDMVGRAFFRSLFYLPCILPAVASSFVWILLMNPDFGLFNIILHFLHLPESKFFWDKGSVLPSIVFMGIWSTGSTQVIFLAGLQNIPRVYYEALEIDGGNVWHKFWSVTLPMLSSTLFFNLVMGIISALQVFGAAYIITEGGPNNSSLFYVFNLWRQAFKYMDMGKASAMAWILFVVVLLATLFIFKTSNKWVYNEGGVE